jgi:hypothetical protein
LVLNEKHDIISMSKLYANIGQLITAINEQMQVLQNRKHMDTDIKPSEPDRPADRNRAAQLTTQIRQSAGRIWLQSAKSALRKSKKKTYYRDVFP